MVRREWNAAGEDTIVGAAIGATAATAASLVTMFAIAGVGTVVGVGWLAAILGSMAIGGITGGGACTRRRRPRRWNAGQCAGTAGWHAAN
jgi:hypothetical protein